MKLGKRLPRLVFIACLVALASLPAMAYTQAPTSPAPQAQANTIRFETISLEEGLSENFVTAILQDWQGFMWFGTEDGLNKYDGYEFVVYKHDPDDPTTLSDDEVSAIYEDRSGDLWIGTYNGLNRFDRTTGTFTRYQHDPDDPQSLSWPVVLSICEGRAGTLWVGTEGGGLGQLDQATDTFTHYQHAPDDPRTLSNDSVYAIYKDRSGELWVGTDGGLDRFDRTTGTFTHYRHDPNDPQSLGDNSVRVIFEDRQGVLWIGTDGGGLDRMDRPSQTFIHYEHSPGDLHGLSDNRVQAILEDGAGRLWVGSPSGLDLLDRSHNRFVHYQHDPNDPHSLSDNMVYAICEDRSGTLWIGTGLGGLSKYSRATDQFTLYQHRPNTTNSLSDNAVYSIYEDQSGNLWIGTRYGGLNRLDRNSDTFTVYQHDPADPNSLSSNQVRTILEDHTGALWIGTRYGGLNQFEPQTETFTHYRHDPSTSSGQAPNDPGSLSEDWVSVIYKDRSDNLWIGTWDSGLDRLDRATGAFVHYQHDPSDPSSLSNNSVRSIYEDPAGMLWVGTSGGGISLLDRDNNRFTHYAHDPDDPQSLSSNDSVLSIYEDATGTVWIASYGGGLNRFDRATQTFTHYTEKDGLPNDMIYCILPDSEGFLWISTNSGLSKFDPRTEVFRNYDVRDGLQSNEFNYGACFQSASGEMFFGGIQGFNAFFPEQVEDNPHLPPIVITAFSKFNQTVRTDLATGEHIQLSYKDNFISFEFAALDYTAPDKNQYAYMLEGQDEDWVYAGTRRHADYTNLRGGDYVFRVKGSNNDGVWNEEGVAVYITVTPPVWETWWFRGIVVLLLMGSVITAYRLRVRSIEARSRELERQVEERTAELSRTNVLLEQEITERERMEEALAQQAAEAAVATERNRLALDLHDSVTQALYGMTLHAKVASLLLSSGQVDLVADHVREMQDAAQEALGEMRLLIFELRPPVLEDGLVSALQARLEAVESRAGLETEFNLEGEIRLPPEIEGGLYRIAQEALNNALKHAQARSIIVSLRHVAHQRIVVLEIADDGMGFDPTAARDQGGMGLRGMEERAAQFGGQLTIQSRPGAGTSVRVEVCQ